MQLFLLLLSLVSFGSACRAEALGAAYARAFRFELQSIIDVHPRYAWGGAENEKSGLDCSGYLYLAARRAGFPVRRTTARRMARGEGGWIGHPVARDRLKLLDLVFWTFQERRTNGHVGAVWRTPKRGMQGDPRRVPGKGPVEKPFAQVTHASSRRGVVVDPLTGRLSEKHTKTIRLTIGDKR